MTITYSLTKKLPKKLLTSLQKYTLTTNAYSVWSFFTSLRYSDPDILFLQSSLENQKLGIL